MSYCRWSSDDFQCDVYVYEDCMGGWTTHVAGRRHVLKKPLPPPVDIGLPHDGEMFNDATPGECADRLEELRALGYRVPQYAIDALKEEESER